VTPASLLMALPIATWEISVGVYMLVKGFRTSPATSGPANVVPAPAAALTHA
jgi:hypothetical protein